MKRLHLLLATLALLCTTGQAWGQTVIASGECGWYGDNLTWTLTDDGTLTISGEGMMDDYYRGRAPWYKEKDEIYSVKINDGVTNIGDYAFYDCTKLHHIYLPESLTSIGDYALYGCALIIVTIPANLTNIGNYAFYACYDMVLLADLQKSQTTSIGDYALYGCSKLISIDLPESLTSIGDYAFCHSRLPTIGLPDSLTSIGDYAFRDCTNETYLHLPENLTHIGNGVFRDCTGLTSIRDTPESLTDIGAETFYGCTSLTDIDLPDSLKSIEVSTFYGCTSLRSIGIPDNLTSIGDSAFCGCTGLSNINFYYQTENLTSIGDYAFSGCTELKSINLPKSLTSMGNYAFQGCTGLTSFTIPENVASVGDGVFNNCPDLNTLYYNAIRCTIGTEVWPFLSTVHIGAQVKSISGTHDGEETFDDSIKEVHITDIAAWCGIEFGDSVNNPLYQDSACLYLNGEEIKHHVVIPDSVTYFGSYALYGIDFEYVRMLGHTPPTYNSTSFSFSQSEKGTLFVPFGSKEDYTAAGWDYTFEIYEGDLLTLHVSTPGTLLDEVVEAGSQPSHVLGLTLSGTLDDADYETMKGMWQLCFLDLTDTDSKSLPQGIFSSRPLKEVSLPSSMTTLGASAFENCERLHTINLEHITDIGIETFFGCTTLKDSISLPDIRNIGGYAFLNSSLRSVLLGRNTQSVAYDAFSGCRLESITCKSETPPSVSRTFSNIIDKGNCVLYVPQSALADYLRATAWKDFYHMEGVDFGPAYTLTVQSADETQGTTTGGGVYEEGEEITITATALPGYHFVQWNDGSTQNPRTIAVTEDKSFYATFEKDVNFFQLTFKCGTGGNVRYAGNTYTNGSVTVSDAEPIRVLVVPQTGYEITSVTLNGGLLQPDSDGWVSFLVTTDCTLEVKFEAIHYMIDVRCDTEKGQVSGGGEYAYGTQATLMATPYSGYHFVQWSDGNTDNPRTITVTEDKSFYATFESDVNALSTTSVEGLAIYPNPATTHVDIQAKGVIKRVLLHSLPGTLLMDENGHDEATHRLDLTRLPQGTYLLTVETFTGVCTERIVKE